MAPRTENSDNVLFLFKCIESSGIKIDFTKAGTALGINANAARMRYSRLRKAVLSGASDQTRKPRSLPFKARKIAGYPKPTADSNNEKKRKIEEDDDYSTESEVSVLEIQDKRGTRGIKIDFSERSTGIEALDNIDDSAIRTNKSTIKPEMGVDEKTKQPISQVVASPKPTENNIKTRKVVAKPKANVFKKAKQQTSPIATIPKPAPATITSSKKAARTSLQSVTPAEDQKNRAPATPKQLQEYANEQVQADFIGLQSGQKVSATIFKRRKLNSPGIAHEQTSELRLDQVCPPPSFARIKRPARDIRAASCVGADINYTNLAGVVTPSESVSVVGEANAGRAVRASSQTNDSKSTAVTGSSLLRRLSSFWK